MKIEWYPGHMAKAKRQIAEVMPKIDVVIEVLDARLPVSSANPMLEKLRGQKPCIKVLNKSDLADPEVTAAWVKYFDQMAGVKAIPIEANNRSVAAQIPKLCRIIVPHKGVPGKTLRAMVVGIPNVGKSTLINTLAGKKMARVGDKPAITTCPQQIDLRNGIHLSDTPWSALAGYSKSEECLSPGGQWCHRRWRDGLRRRGFVCRRVPDGVLSQTSCHPLQV